MTTPAPAASDAPRALHCPVCRNRLLIPFKHDFSLVDLCPSCGGFWCEPRDWRKPDLGEPPRLAGEHGGRGEGIREEGVSERTCPACAGPMARLEFEGIRGFAIEKCDACGGVWFDKREWEFLEAFRAQEQARAEIAAPTTWGQWLFNFILRMPVEFNVRPRRLPVVTILIIIADFVLLAFGAQGWVGEYGVVPSDFESPGSFFERGWVQLVTYQFLHGNWMHVFGNAYLLLVLGDNVEDAMGPLHFLLFYLFCGVAGGLAFALMMGPHSLPLIGASGSVSGVIAAYLLLYREARLTLMLVIKQVKAPAAVWVGLYLLIQIASHLLDPESRLTHVAWVAHLAGFAAGLAWMVPARGRIIRGHALLTLLATRRI